VGALADADADFPNSCVSVCSVCGKRYNFAAGVTAYLVIVVQ
jgi:hypothetical protein